MLSLNTKTSNCFIRMLTLLEVKYTQKYAAELYESNPRNNTLLGLTEMFAKYNIQTQCYQFSSEVTLEELPMPFVAIIANEFFTIEELQDDGVLVTIDTRTEVIERSSFYKGWNGRGLFITEVEHAMEPDLITSVQENKIAWAVGIVCGCALIVNVGYVLVADFRLSTLLYLFTDFAGMYLSWLSLKQNRSEVRKKLCSIFKEANCEKVHHSKASNILGYPLGIIGITYFISCFVIELYFPTHVTVLQFISYLALFFAVWSIGYQKFIVKAWCPVCLLTQLVISTKAMLFFLTNEHSWSGISFPAILFTLSIFGICFYVIQAFNELWEKSNQSLQMRRELIGIKGDYRVFRYLLEQQEKYDTARCSRFVVGNTQAEHEVVLLMNPFCGPCDALHKKLNKLLENPEILSGYRFRFVFTAFTAEKERVIIAWIGYYLDHTPENALQLVGEWYANKDLEKMLGLYEHYKDSVQVQEELALQTRWIERSKLTATPYILFDGYVFPKEYQVTDLEYLNI